MPGTPRTDAREWSWDRPWPEYATSTTQRVRTAHRVRPARFHPRFGHFGLIVVVATLVAMVVSVVSAGAAFLL